MKFKSKCKKTKTVNGFVTGLVIGGIIFTGIGGVAVTLTADQIKYTPSDSKFKVTNAKEALDEIYKISEYEILDDTYFYEAGTEGDSATIIRYKKIDNQFYVCDAYGIVADGTSATDVTSKTLVPYTATAAGNLSAGSAGYASNSFILGDGSDNASYYEQGDAVIGELVDLKTFEFSPGQSYTYTFATGGKYLLCVASGGSWGGYALSLSSASVQYEIISEGVNGKTSYKVLKIDAQDNDSISFIHGTAEGAAGMGAYILYR